MGAILFPYNKDFSKFSSALVYVTFVLDFLREFPLPMPPPPHFGKIDLSGCNPTTKKRSPFHFRHMHIKYLFFAGRKANPLLASFSHSLFFAAECLAAAAAGKKVARCSFAKKKGRNNLHISGNSNPAALPSHSTPSAA